MSAETPLVSVVTACHNAARYVGETIESVLAQTHPAVEHLVVDDASTDGSREIVEGYAAAHPARVRLLRVEHNRGPGHARNVGVAAARGEYLFFLDADDLVTPDTFAALVEAVRGVPAGIAACECRYWKECADGTWGEAPRHIPIPAAGADLFRAFLEQSAWAPTCSTLWRRDAYALTDGYDESMVRDEDTDLLLSAYARGARIVPAARGTGYYRTFGGTRASVSSGISETRFRSAVRVLDKLSAELRRLGREGEYAPLLGRSYRRNAMYGFQMGFPGLARGALRRAEALGAHEPVSPRAAGRLVERLLGLERKERLARGLARLGITTPTRRRALRLQRAVRAAEAGA
jgi:glycosyltransferase involved in cell wall biosynthesis